jgi:hypothetical protein
MDRRQWFNFVTMEYDGIVEISVPVVVQSVFFVTGA